MGATEGCSMMYLEARCLAVTRAAGSQGTQNGGIDGVNVAGSVPDGMREVIAENLLAMMHDLESCTGNDTLMSSSDIRRTAHTLPLLLAGSDFLFSGFGSIPAYDNAFGPSNFNAEDIDDYLVVQRDWGFEGVLRPQSDAELLPLRRRAVEALRAVLDELDLARFSDEDAEAVVQAHGSLDVPALDPHLVPDAADAAHAARPHGARRRAGAGGARLRGRGRARARHAAPAALRRLPADLGDLHRGHEGALGALRPERLRRARHGLPHDAPRAAWRRTPCGRSGRRRS